MSLYWKSWRKTKIFPSKAGYLNFLKVYFIIKHSSLICRMVGDEDKRFIWCGYPEIRAWHIRTRRRSTLPGTTAHPSCCSEEGRRCHPKSCHIYLCINVYVCVCVRGYVYVCMYIYLHTHIHVSGSVKFNGRESKSCLGQVFNSKLGRIVTLLDAVTSKIEKLA